MKNRTNGGQSSKQKVPRPRTVGGTCFNKLVQTIIKIIGLIDLKVADAPKDDTDNKTKILARPLLSSLVKPSAECPPRW